MPKMKSKSAMKKRFKITGSGKVVRHHSGHNHKLGNKNMKHKRHLRQSAVVDPAFAKNILRLLVQ